MMHMVDVCISVSQYFTFSFLQMRHSNTLNFLFEVIPLPSVLIVLMDFISSHRDVVCNLELVILTYLETGIKQRSGK